MMQGGPGKISPFVIPKMIANAAAGNVSIQFGASGPCTAVATACSSAANAIGDALRTIQHEQADVCLTGGSEAGLTPMGLGGFTSARALSTRNEDPQGASVRSTKTGTVSFSAKAPASLSSKSWNTPVNAGRTFTLSC